MATMESKINKTKALHSGTLHSSWMHRLWKHWMMT